MLATMKFFRDHYGFAVLDDGGEVYVGSYAIEGGVTLEAGDRVAVGDLIESPPGKLRAKTVKLVERREDWRRRKAS
jgi:cold shock CspA family protein